ncbi:MAG: (Fe-S)-binding protein [Anaerolineales bacterium]|jgi:L-lactate dehydrogenase complex protein LldE
MIKAQLLTTCLIDSFFPQTAQAVLMVLASAGVELHVPDKQTCCGQPAFNGGLWDEAARLARRTIEIFDQEPDLPVIIPSGSCAGMVRHSYLELFRDQPGWAARARRLADRTYELTEFLCEKTSFIAPESLSRVQAAYHASCHLARGLGVKDQPLHLMHRLAPQGFSSLPMDCCGFGGVFSVEYPSISEAILSRRLDQIQVIDPQFVIACDVSCLMQIEGGLRKRGSQIRCSHIAMPLAGREPGLR